MTHVLWINRDPQLDSLIHLVPLTLEKISSQLTGGAGSDKLSPRKTGFIGDGISEYSVLCLLFFENTRLFCHEEVIVVNIKLFPPKN